MHFTKLLRQLYHRYDEKLNVKEIALSHEEGFDILIM